MRKILFRGKRIDNGEWVEGYLIQKGGETLIVRYPYCTGKVHETSWSEFCFGGFIEVIPETVGQYTGLTDKNGKKIFEGDICNISIPRIDGGFNRHNKCLCSYEDGMYKFSSYSDIYFCMGNGYGYPDTCHQNIEVIDNIHDNPKLLNNFKNQ